MHPPGSRPSGHRRSTVSETSLRRVLQELDWWAVAPGQFQEHDDDDDGGEGTPDDEQPPTPPEPVPVAEMAALAIAPRHGQESSSSSDASVESTPEQTTRDTPPALRRSVSETSPPIHAFTFEDLPTHDHDHQYADFSTSPLSSPLLFSH
uniref:Uncharacterized protein n=1 Tax=Mycena chlorophos TaxID=658473 RepID=A0ABQ0LQE3_MYCCL|nr:predicted protein [Mycena chlorophos]